MASIDGESLELEVKHKDNGSWHPCRVSLSSSDSKFGIVIDFENSNEEDIISSKEDALARLRFRSTPLQDGECSHIKEGDSVLAMYKDQFRSMFFDAVIEKPNRVKHSKRVFCRCTFEIKWLNPELNEETMTTISSKSIMKLSTEEIDRHPKFAAFLNALHPTDGVKTSSPLSFLEETDYDADLQGILEAQIEQISKLADEPIERSADLLEFKRASFGGYKQKKAAATLRASSNNHQNNFRRSTRSQNKEQTEVGLKKPEEDKLFLSPLAARAALASLVHERELPLKQELSFSLAGKQDQEILFQRDFKKHIEMDSLGFTYGYMKCGSSSQDNIWNRSNLFQIGDDDTHSNSRGTSIHSNQRGPPKVTKPKESPYLEKPSQATEGSEGERGSTVGIVNKSIGSRKVGKLNGRPMPSRVTRSSMHKETEVSPVDVKEGSSTEKLTNPVSTTRKTRSPAHKKTEASLDEAKQGSADQKLTCPVIRARVTRSRNQKEQRNPEVDQEPEISDLIHDTRGTSVQIKGVKESRPTIDSATVRKLSGQSMTTRVTRAVVHKETEASSDETKQGFSSKKSKSKNKRSSSPVDLNTESPHEGNKRTRASHAATITTEDSGAVLEDSEDASVEKKKADRKKTIPSKKPQLRSSPRLQFHAHK